MEIQSWKFFMFWALISISFLHLGLDKLDRTGLPKSITPLLSCIFKHALAISTCHSSSYALIFRPRIKLPVERRYIWLVLGSFVFSIRDPTILFNLWFFGFFLFKDRYLLLLPASFTWYLLYELYHLYLPLCTLINSVLLALVDNPLHEKISLAFHMLVEGSQFLVHGQGLFFPVLVISVSFLTSACHAAICGIQPYTEFSWDDPSKGDETFKKTFLPLAVKANKVVSMIIKENQTWKMVRFASAMMGTVLFQKFFKLTSFDEVVACLHLAVVCLANLTLLRVEDDLGFFHLVLGNVIVGCTVSEFGLGGITWIAYGTTLLLFGLRLKLQSLTFETIEDGEDRREVVVL